jgi:D-alanyl-D-alanine carboxypeptidase/D-alanyl-D-alanine-endopeptidase (penicillin-binding protein 4)
MGVMRRCAMVSISLLTAFVPALAQTGEIPSALLSPPAPQHQQGRPSLQLQPGRLCEALQQTIRSVLGPQIGAWSITVLDENGALLADVNGTVPRVPASNQKLLSTAFALDRLGTDFRLRTRLLRHADGSMEIVGEGDPDLSIAEIQRFAMVALGEGGSRSTNTPETPIRLLVREEPKRRWWHSDWQQADRTYAYGAPITRLALTSNALSSAVMNPAARLQRILDSTARQQGGRLSMVMVDHEQRERGAPIAGDDTVVLHSEDSAPMHALLSLANTESHNFTAEVLLREAADDWDVNRAALANTRWLQSQGISTAGLRIRDGSGLSRGNRVTSRTLAELLLRMGQHPMASYYQASMAIAGQRGTLRHLYRGTPLEGRFWGKTGTLRGVRTLSGILETADGPRYLSMISNGGSTPNTVMGKVLRASQRLSRCA